MGDVHIVFADDGCADTLDLIVGYMKTNRNQLSQIKRLHVDVPLQTDQKNNAQTQNMNSSRQSIKLHQVILQPKPCDISGCSNFRF